MWLFKLLVILAFSNVHVIVRAGHRHTNTCAVKVNGDTDEVKRIVETYGFSYKLKVNDKYFLQCLNYNVTPAGENVDIYDGM